MASGLALCPGSYDPITNGHVDIILRTADVFEKVGVLVSQNSSKNPLFTFDERMEMCVKVFSDYDNIEVMKCGELIVDIYKNMGASAIVKGVRDAADCQYEMELARINEAMGENKMCIRDRYKPA